MNNNSNMVIHVLADVSQEASSNDGDSPKRNGSIVHIRVSFREGNLTRMDDVVPCGYVAIDAGEIKDLVDQRGTSKSCCFEDGSAKVCTIFMLAEGFSWPGNAWCDLLDV